MKVIVLLTLVAIALAKRSPRDVTADTKGLQDMAKCFLDQAPCSSNDQKCKDIIPECLKTGCAACTAEQKEQADAFFSYLVKNDADSFNNFVKKYDSKEEYFLGLLKNVGVAELDQGTWKQMFNCFFSVSRCTAEFRRYKNMIPMAMARRCANCSPHDKQVFHEFFTIMVKNRSAFNRFIQTHDPQETTYPSLFATLKVDYKSKF